jgi:hypothetical protein
MKRKRKCLFLWNKKFKPYKGLIKTNCKKVVELMAMTVLLLVIATRKEGNWQVFCQIFIMRHCVKNNAHRTGGNR